MPVYAYTIPEGRSRHRLSLSMQPDHVLCVAHSGSVVGMPTADLGRLLPADLGHDWQWRDGQIWFSFAVREMAQQVLLVYGVTPQRMRSRFDTDTGRTLAPILVQALP